MTQSLGARLVPPCSDHASCLRRPCTGFTIDNFIQTMIDYNSKIKFALFGGNVSQWRPLTRQLEKSTSLSLAIPIKLSY